MFCWENNSKLNKIDFSQIPYEKCRRTSFRASRFRHFLEGIPPAPEAPSLVYGKRLVMSSQLKCFVSHRPVYCDGGWVGREKKKKRMNT